MTFERKSIVGIGEGAQALFKDNKNFPKLENIYFNKPKQTED